MKVIYHEVTNDGRYQINISEKGFEFPQINEGNFIKFDNEIYSNIDKAFLSTEKKVAPLIITFTIDNIIEVDNVINYVENKMINELKNRKLKKEFVQRFYNGNETNKELRY